MTQPHFSQADRAARQRDINQLRPRTDGAHLKLAILLALGNVLPEQARTDDEWIIVQVRCRIGVECEEPGQGTVIRSYFECGDISLAQYTGEQTRVASIRSAEVLTLDPGDVVHLHWGHCPCGQSTSKPALPFGAFDPAKVPGLVELRAGVRRGSITGDTESAGWPT